LFSAALTLPLVLFGLLYFVDVDDFRAEISRNLSTALGRTVEFDGPISLEPSLTPRLVIDGLSIANPDWASRPALALVERFKVRASLLALLQGELEILALEFHGVDLQLEQGPGELNNFTFASSGHNNVLPAIEQMSLYDTTLSWLPYEGVARSVQLQRVTVHNVPSQPVALELAAEVNGEPLELALLAEPRGDSWHFGPWETTVQVAMGDLSLELLGTVPLPTRWYEGSYRFELQGTALQRLNSLLGVNLPALGAYGLGGDIRFSLNDYLVISNLSGEIAETALAGSARWELGKLEARPASWRSALEAGEFDVSLRAEEAIWKRTFEINGRQPRLSLRQVQVKAGPGRPLAITAQASFDNAALAVNLQAQPLAQLLQQPQGPWQELILTAAGDGMQLSLAGSVAYPREVTGFDLAVVMKGRKFADLLGLSGDFELVGHYREQPDRYELEDFSLTLSGADFRGRAALYPPGNQLPPLLEFTSEQNLPGLLRQVELDLAANVSRGLVDEPLALAGRSLELNLSTVHASALPGQPLQLTADASVNGTAIRLGLRGEPLEQLARNPAGPWRNLKLQGRGEGIGFSMEGDIRQPLELRGVDAALELGGVDASRLLSRFDLGLPVQGLYSLSGRLTDTGDSVVLDDFTMNLGRNDIAGRLQFFPAGERPRLLLDLRSEQLYLAEILPGSLGAPAAAEPGRVIPDIDFPFEYLRQIDARLRFSGEQLSTAGGSIGGISFALALENHRLSLEEFLVKGWAGSRVQASGSIDVTRERPVIDFKMSTRDFNYGALLSRTDLTHIVEGTLDISAALSAEGNNSREILGSANGELILVGGRGRFGSRRLGLWGSNLITTMLSPSWHRQDVTELNCVVARVRIDNGVATSDTMLVDTSRVTIGASGTLDFGTEQLTVDFAPRPKRSNLVSLSNPARLTGTLSAPVVQSSVLPRRRLAVLGGGVLAGLLNPAYLVLAFSQLGSGNSSPCESTIEATEAARAQHFGSAP
jgi:hypothetical protein